MTDTIGPIQNEEIQETTTTIILHRIDLWRRKYDAICFYHGINAPDLHSKLCAHIYGGSWDFYHNAIYVGTSFLFSTLEAASEFLLVCVTLLLFSLRVGPVHSKTFKKI